MPGQPLLTPRDLEVLTALDHSPLTAQQLLTVSRTFARPFTDERRVRERLQTLAGCGRVRRWPYATAGRGAPHYYTLSRLGFSLLHGDSALPPTRRAFSPVGLARQHHTFSLADFLVHTLVGAHQAGVAVTDVSRENTLRLEVGEESLFPDCAFRLLPPGGGVFSFYVELDNSSERVRSDKDEDSWERKIRLYNTLADQSPQRFRVLVVTTRSARRLNHILTASLALAPNKHRRLFYGVHLPDYLRCVDALTAECFLDPRGGRVALVPGPARRAALGPVIGPVLVAEPVSC